MSQSHVPVPTDPDADPELDTNQKNDYELYDRSNLYAKGESIRSELNRTADRNLSLEVGLDTIRDFDSNDGSDDTFENNPSVKSKGHRSCIPKDLDLTALLAKERRSRKILLLLCIFLSITCFALIVDESRRMTANEYESGPVNNFMSTNPEKSNTFENNAAQEFQNEILGGDYPPDGASSGSQGQSTDILYNNVGGVDGVDPPVVLSDEQLSDHQVLGQQQEQVYEEIEDTADRIDPLFENDEALSGIAPENENALGELNEMADINEEMRTRVSAKPLSDENNPLFRNNPEPLFENNQEPLFENNQESSGLAAEITNVVGDLSQWEETADGISNGDTAIYPQAPVDDPLISFSDEVLPINLKFRTRDTFNIREQPNGSDLPFLWYIPKSGSNIMKHILEKCYALVDDITEEDGEDAASSYHPPKITMSNDPNKISDYFRNDNNLEQSVDQQQLGRCFAVFRNPIDRAVSIFYHLQSTTDRWKDATIDAYANSVECENNWMVRELTGKSVGGPLTMDDLAQAKNFIREYCVIGLQEELAESIGRFEGIFGWRSQDAKPDGSSLCIDRTLQNGELDPPNYQKYEQDSYVYSLFRNKNYFDTELYRYATQLFAQRPT